MLKDFLDWKLAVLAATVFVNPQNSFPNYAGAFEAGVLQLATVNVSQLQVVLETKPGNKKNNLVSLCSQPCLLKFMFLQYATKLQTRLRFCRDWNYWRDYVPMQHYFLSV